jgi:ppGpp synthetase/RelA/SpoT-type nucleotidyltranferase
MSDTPELISEIDRFVKSWRDISSVYEKLALEVRERCEDGLSARAVKCIISHRAKPGKSLKGSIERRQRTRMSEGKTAYENEDQIKDDMVDLAGVRVALYFPDDLQRVQEYINEDFEEAKPPLVWGVNQSGQVVNEEIGSRFLGYRATHFRVRLKKEYGHRETKDELLGRTVEVQVTSVVMHAWADIHHDLIYKPYAGALSADERRILDLINGLAHTGEVALQQLQALLEKRVNQLDRKFADQYELGAWFKTYVTERFKDVFKNYPPHMELSKLLLDTIRLQGLDTPRALQACLDDAQAVHPLPSTESLFEPIKVILERMESMLGQGTRSQSVDMTRWALLRIVARHMTPVEQPDQDRMEKICLRASIFVSSINMALSLGHDPNQITIDIQDIAKTVGISSWSNWILPIILGGDDTQATEELEATVDILWKEYLSALKDWVTFEVEDTSEDEGESKNEPDGFPERYNSALLWLIGFALSAGLGMMASPNNLRISGNPSEKTFMWPGALGWPSRKAEVMTPRKRKSEKRSENPDRNDVPHNPLTPQNPDRSLHEPPCELVFVLSPSGIWHTREFARNNSWFYSKVSFTKIMKGEQWIELRQPYLEEKGTPKEVTRAEPQVTHDSKELRSMEERIKELESTIVELQGAGHNQNQ